MRSNFGGSVPGKAAMPSWYGTVMSMSFISAPPPHGSESAAEVDEQGGDHDDDLHAAPRAAVPDHHRRVPEQRERREDDAEDDRDEREMGGGEPAGEEVEVRDEQAREKQEGEGDEDRHTSCLVVLPAEQPVHVAFSGFDAGLIEGIDVPELAGHGRGRHERLEQGSQRFSGEVREEERAVRAAVL